MDFKMKEQRRSDRRRTYLAGRIVFNGRSSTMDCLVRNLSRNGALLEFSEPVIPRHEVDLCIPNSLARLTSGVVWCNGVRAGVSIAQPDSILDLYAHRVGLRRPLRRHREALAKRAAQLR